MTMDAQEEKAWEAGHLAAWRNILGTAMREVRHADDITLEAMVAERAAAVVALRELCKEFGDNEWPDNLHLSDVIEKRLGRPLRWEREQSSSGAAAARAVALIDTWLKDEGPLDDYWQRAAWRNLREIRAALTGPTDQEGTTS